MQANKRHQEQEDIMRRCKDSQDRVEEPGGDAETVNETEKEMLLGFHS
jgi:hypothetical protein